MERSSAKIIHKINTGKIAENKKTYHGPRNKLVLKTVEPSCISYNFFWDRIGHS